MALNAGGQETSPKVVSGTFTATGQSAPFRITGASASYPVSFNVVLSGTFVATVSLERSFDNGANWAVVNADPTGSAATYTAGINVRGTENEDGVMYRWNCTAYTSGTVSYRISQ